MERKHTMEAFRKKAFFGREGGGQCVCCYVGGRGGSKGLYL